MSDDTDIVQRILAGDHQAYAVLVRKYEASVRGCCLGMLPNPSDADDAAQEVFIKAYHALGSFRGDAAFSTWLYRIAANHCRDLLRRSARHQTESWDALLEQQGDRIEALLSTPPDVEIPMEQTELMRRVFACLPEQYRTILILREVDGLSYQELAETLACSLDAVKGRLKRARQELADRLRHISRAPSV